MNISRINQILSNFGLTLTVSGAEDFSISLLTKPAAEARARTSEQLGRPKSSGTSGPLLSTMPSVCWKGPRRRPLGS